MDASIQSKSTAAAGDLKAERRDYTLQELREDLAGDDPFRLFAEWFDAYSATGALDASAMVLATVDAEGQPSARVMLLKEYAPSGFVFFTNFESRKGAELTRNPRASLLFFWAAQERQVRIEGRVEKIDDDAAQEYFVSRPRGSQIAAATSDQSRVVGSRAALEERYREIESAVGDGPVPKPPHWGGYLLVPHRIEFWQGRPNRLHDRLVYTRDGGGPWERYRLQP